MNGMIAPDGTVTTLFTQKMLAQELYDKMKGKGLTRLAHRKDTIKIGSPPSFSTVGNRIGHTQKDINALLRNVVDRFTFIGPPPPRVKPLLRERVISGLSEALRRVQDAYRVLVEGADLEDDDI